MFLMLFNWIVFVNTLTKTKIIKNEEFSYPGYDIHLDFLHLSYIYLNGNILYAIIFICQFSQGIGRVFD